MRSKSRDSELEFMDENIFKILRHGTHSNGWTIAVLIAIDLFGVVGSIDHDY